MATEETVVYIVKGPSKRGLMESLFETDHRERPKFVKFTLRMPGDEGNPGPFDLEYDVFIDSIRRLGPNNWDFTGLSRLWSDDTWHQVHGQFNSHDRFGSLSYT